jgi:hypothetical protein
MDMVEPFMNGVKWMTKVLQHPSDRLRTITFSPVFIAVNGRYQCLQEEDKECWRALDLVLSQNKSLENIHIIFSYHFMKDQAALGAPTPEEINNFFPYASQISGLLEFCDTNILTSVIKRAEYGGRISSSPKI